MFKIDHQRIVIISTPRTGSTALAEHVSTVNNLRLYIEPHNNENVNFNDFKQVVRDYSPMMFKVHAFDFFKRYSGDVVADKFYWIKLSRRDTVKQIASQFISTQRKQWFYRHGENLELRNQIIEIDDVVLLRTVRAIQFHNRFLESFSYLNGIAFNQEVFQEDLQISSSLAHTPLPSNYDEILDSVKMLLKDNI